MHCAPLPRLDRNGPERRSLLPFCRLRSGEIWDDPVGKHRVGCGDATDAGFIGRLMAGRKASLAVQDPPYNIVLSRKRAFAEFTEWCRWWVDISWRVLAENASLYVWMGGDQSDHFQPLPHFMIMMSETGFRSRSHITMRNQRGYGTQKNWMAVRQELLYYVKGDPSFTVQYTDIPKSLRGYYKTVGQRHMENLERSKSPTIRPGNVWFDVQQVFYRLEENVNGCYAQKPLKAIERIIQASSAKGDLVIDFFSHAGTTLLAAERTGRLCVTADVDPVFAEITIRRLERFRAVGKTGWQAGHAFEAELKSRDSAAIALPHRTAQSR